MSPKKRLRWLICDRIFTVHTLLHRQVHETFQVSPSPTLSLPLSASLADSFPSESADRSLHGSWPHWPLAPRHAHKPVAVPSLRLMAVALCAHAECSLLHQSPHAALLRMASVHDVHARVIVSVILPPVRVIERVVVVRIVTRPVVRRDAVVQPAVRRRVQRR